MMELELRVRKARGHWGSVAWCSKSAAAVICLAEMRRHVIDLNERRSLFAVFTKIQAGDHDFFKIYSDGGVVEFDGTYYEGAKRRMRAAYRQGYRYIHFEQPDE